MLTKAVPNNTRGHMTNPISPFEGVTGQMIGCPDVASVVWTEVPSSSVEPTVMCRHCLRQHGQILKVERIRCFVVK